MKKNFTYGVYIVSEAKYDVGLIKALTIIGRVIDFFWLTQKLTDKGLIISWFDKHYNVYALTELGRNI